MMALACLAVLVVASTLTPDARGHGTHEQLGLNPCGWAAATGYPCATCGMTTSFVCAVGRDWIGSLKAQPMGTLFVLGASAAFWGGLHVAVFGSRIASACATLVRGKVLAGIGILWALSWAYKAAVWNP
jgi:hypothetical protein